jgi:hypothetical protein
MGEGWRQTLERLAEHLRQVKGDLGAAHDSDTTPDQPPPAPNSRRKRLDALVGEWIMEGTHPVDPSTSVRGRVTFEWLDGESFLVQRWSVEHPDFPNGIAIIGCDASAEACSMHYFDSRGIARVYQMDVDDGEWTVWRDEPGFAQRFTGIFGDGGNTIAGRWERSSDGARWEHDFDLTYRKVSEVTS